MEKSGKIGNEKILQRIREERNIRKTLTRRQHCMTGHQVEVKTGVKCTYWKHPSIMKDVGVNGTLK